MNLDAYHNADNKADFHDNWVSDQERQYEKRKELLAKFTNPEERYYKEPHFHAVIEALARGAEPYAIIDELLKINDRLSKELHDTINRTLRR